MKRQEIQNKYFDQLNKERKMELTDESSENDFDIIIQGNEKTDIVKENNHNSSDDEGNKNVEELVFGNIIDFNNIKDEIDNHSDDENQAPTPPTNRPVFSLVENSKNQTVNCDDVSFMSDFKEIDSIRRVIQRIKEMNEKAKFKLTNSKECKISDPNILNRHLNSDLPVKDLVDKSSNFIANLIGKASDIKCPFHEISCNLLLDCSSFICDCNKLYNFMILIAFSYALSALEIPFSIALVADQNFRFISKSFEEEISFYVLQRILDCLFIKRYKTNISDTFNHALKHIKCSDEKRTHRALFFFSDRIDENLVLAKSWRETLLNEQKNSFGMIFIKSDDLLKNIEYVNIILNMWNVFSDVTKTAPSITRLVSIDHNMQFDSIVTMFCTVLSRP